MDFSRSDADIFVPDGVVMPDALARTTHMAVGAHQDDQEFMAFEGIFDCFGQTDKWFSGVCVTDGGGSARSGIYSDYSDEEMMMVRLREQRKAAQVGEYACEIQLRHPSSAVKDSSNRAVVDDLTAIFEIAQPQVVYLHNPADKHDTHVATMLRAIAALRNLPKEQRPVKVLGSEIWRSLDWMNDDEKQIMRVDGTHNLAAALCGVYDSQISGGKRYDVAITGRWATNATMYDSHATDDGGGMSYAMDLTPVVADESICIAEYTLEYIERFRSDVTERLRKFK